VIKFVPEADSVSGRALRRLGRVVGLRSETVYSRAILLLTLMLFALGGIVVSALWFGLFRQFDLADEQEARTTARNVQQFFDEHSPSGRPTEQDLSDAAKLLGRRITLRESDAEGGTGGQEEITIRRRAGGVVEASFALTSGNGVIVVAGARPFYETGVVVARLVLAGLAVGGGIALLLVLFVVDRTVLGRIQLLADKVENEKKSERLPVALDVPGDDEIAQLANSIEELARLVQAAEREYRNVVEDQIESICRFDAAGRITFFNRGFEELCGNSLAGHHPPLDSCLDTSTRTFLREN